MRLWLRTPLSSLTLVRGTARANTTGHSGGSTRYKLPHLFSILLSQNGRRVLQNFPGIRIHGLEGVASGNFRLRKPPRTRARRSNESTFPKGGRQVPAGAILASTSAAEFLPEHSTARTPPSPRGCSLPSVQSLTLPVGGPVQPVALGPTSGWVLSPLSRAHVASLVEILEDSPEMARRMNPPRRIGETHRNGGCRSSRNVWNGGCRGSRNVWRAGAGSGEGGVRGPVG